MKYLKNKPVRIEGLNGLFIGRIMSSANYQNPNFDFETKPSSDIPTIIAELEEYISSKLEEIKKEEEKRKLFLLTEEGKKEEKINKFLSHVKKDFQQIEQIIWSWNYKMMFKFYEEDGTDYVLDTGTGDPTWNDKAEKDLSIYMEKVNSELKYIEDKFKIKFNGSTESLFYWDLPSYGYIPCDIDYNNEHILKNKKTKEFILNCELI